MALQVHESIGHPTELDRVLGEEAAFAGTSFLRLEDVGSLQYGSDHRHGDERRHRARVARQLRLRRRGRARAARLPGARRRPSRASRARARPRPSIGRASNGCMRADGWNRIPLIRMTTVSLEPGDVGLRRPHRRHRQRPLHRDQQLLVDRRQAAQLPVRLRDRLGDQERRTRDAWSRTRTTPASRRSSGTRATRSARETHWRVWGLPNCGKGEPMQVAHVAHGAAPARFRGVQVGVGR